ncbi:hypothetical protein [uncultured Thiodictyon sp.]|jgi:hypothetical protein|uniref:hypothetical protein n=1 Tax=uncultured Thiodictyon sp. TaxID=1846217 RepID=UPI0025DB9095|nr:hypothetical protein [uncultured Thiodictyon sp.]
MDRHRYPRLSGRHCARLVQDRSDLPPPAPAATLLAPILADLPARGRLTTHPVTAGTTSGRTNIHAASRQASTRIICLLPRLPGSYSSEPLHVYGDVYGVDANGRVVLY